MGVSESLTKGLIVGCVLALDLPRAEPEAKAWVCAHSFLGWLESKWDKRRKTREGPPVQGHAFELGAGDWTWLCREPKGVL